MTSMTVRIQINPGDLDIEFTLPEGADIADVRRALLSTALHLNPTKPQPVLVPAGSVVLQGPGSKT